MSAAHTPGPWQVKPSNNEITNADHGRLPFAIVAGYSLIGATYENGKDAHLIAAAPDLLEALEDLMEMTGEPPDRNCSCHISPPCNDCVDYSGWRDAFEYARAAIAKATEAA